MQWQPIHAAELMLHGISITASALAVHSFTEFRVVRISSRKRRKAWRVDRVVTERPACYQMDGQHAGDAPVAGGEAEGGRVMTEQLPHQPAVAGPVRLNRQFWRSR